MSEALGIASSVRDFVLDAIASTADLERAGLSEDTSLYDLAIDSVVRMSLLSQTEAFYNVRFGSEQVVVALEALHIGELVQLVESVVNVE